MPAQCSRVSFQSVCRIFFNTYTNFGIFIAEGCASLDGSGRKTTSGACLPAAAGALVNGHSWYAVTQRIAKRDANALGHMRRKSNQTPCCTVGTAENYHKPAQEQQPPGTVMCTLLEKGLGGTNEGCESAASHIEPQVATPREKQAAIRVRDELMPLWWQWVKPLMSGCQVVRISAQTKTPKKELAKRYRPGVKGPACIC